VVGADRWQGNWLAVSPPGAIRVDLGGLVGTTRAVRPELEKLPAGTSIVLFASAPGAIHRCRRVASRAGIQREREYLAFPSAATPGYLVEDAPEPVRVFVKTVLAPPPRTRFSTAIAAGLGLVRALSSWRLIRALAPGRVVVGRVT
jgi:hypothetical protein